MPESTVCFICGEDHTLVLVKILSDGRQLGLCLRCVDSTAHIQLFTAAYLAERRATAIAERFVRWLTAGPD